MSVQEVTDDFEPPVGSSEFDEIGSIEGLNAQHILIRRKILWALSVYPKISPSMLQAALGPQRPARTWKPILERLIMQGIVYRDQTSFVTEGGRFRIAIILSLPKHIMDKIESLPKGYLGDREVSDEVIQAHVHTDDHDDDEDEPLAVIGN
jgi:hypothetical protein